MPAFWRAADEERDHEDGERVVASKRGDDDAGVAVELPLEPVRVGVEGVAEVANLARAGETGDRARDPHHREDLPARAHARVARRVRRVAEHLHLEPEPCPRVEEPEPDGHEHGEREPERHRDPALDVERPTRPDRGVGKLLAGREDGGVEALRLAPVRVAVEDQVRQDVSGDVVQHQRRDDLVRLEERLEEARDQRPERAADGTGDDHRPDRDRRGAARAAEVEPGRRREDRAHEQLSFAADVEETHPERRRGREAGERERGRRDQGLAERPSRDERGVADPPVVRERVVPGRLQHDRREEEREQDRADRHDDLQPARLSEPTLDPHGDRALRPSEFRSPRHARPSRRAHRARALRT